MVLESVDGCNFDFFVDFFVESVSLLYILDDVRVLIFVWSDNINGFWFDVSFEEVSNNFFNILCFGFVEVRGIGGVDFFVVKIGLEYYRIVYDRLWEVNIFLDMFLYGDFILERVFVEYI